MADEKKDKEKLVVVGAGPGGYPAAFLAAQLGMNVTLIDPRPAPGGVCLYEGCIPSKTLLHISKVIQEAEQASAWGLHYGNPRIDPDAIRKYSAGVVEKLTGGLLNGAKKRQVEYVQGMAEFADETSVEVNGETIPFDHAIIATGSREAHLPIEPDSDDVLTAADALQIPSIPKSLLVIGGGYIGLELGTVYATLGSKVTVVEATGELLPGVDRELVKVLQENLKKLLEGIHLYTTVEEMKPYKHGLIVSLRNGDGENQSRRFSKVLVAVGRQPNSDGLQLENAGIQSDKDGFIQTDSSRRTSARHIYAIGDVAGEPMLAHKATHEGLTAVRDIAGNDAVFEPAAIPAVIFTHPEIAWTGMDENQAREAGVDARVTRFPWAASGRAATMGRGEGLTKMVFDGRTERLLGVSIVGSGAGELIAEATHAIEMGTRATDLRLSIHPHPTLSETLMEAAGVFFGESAHYRV